MTQYSDIQQAYAAYSEAQYKYWTDLWQKVALITSGFATYLGLDPSSRDGKGERYIDFGKQNGDSFESCHAQDLDTYGLWLQFRLKILVEQAPNSFPKSSLLISLSIRRTADSYVVKIERSDEDIEIVFSREFSDDELTDLYEELALLPIEHYDPAIFE